MERKLFSRDGFDVFFTPLANGASEDGLVEYGRVRNSLEPEDYAYGVAVNGNLVFESFESEVSWMKFDQLLPE